MTPLLLLALPLHAGVSREDALINSAMFATHEWVMGSANETGSCSSSYKSDYSAGEVVVGIPYDWGGWVTPDEFDGYLDQGYGAGSHSWHGVLWCTVGVDCSGFVSQAWETSQKYGTATFYQVTHDIGVSDLERADALNKESSHIVLFAYETDAGLPVHFEANGTVVFVDSDQGWSAFSSYTAIRYDDIEDGPETGTVASPIEITAFPYSDLRTTAGAASDAIDSYACASDTRESGPEQLYHFEVASAGTLTVTVSDDTYTDVDVHLLSAASGDACVDRDDTTLTAWLEPGEHWLSLDTWVSSYEYPGPYLLSATFTGELGSSSSEDPGEDEPEGDTGTVADSQGDDPADDGPPGDGSGPLGGPPGTAQLMEGGGCTVVPLGTGVAWLWLVGVAAVGRRRCPRRGAG